MTSSGGEVELSEAEEAFLEEVDREIRKSWISHGSRGCGAQHQRGQCSFRRRKASRLLFALTKGVTHPNDGEFGSG